MKILFVGNETPNYIHKKFGDSVDADFYGYDQSSLKNILAELKKIPKGYDIYLTEGLFNYVLLARTLGFLDKKARVINIFADPRLFYLKYDKQFDFNANKIKKLNCFKRMFKRYFIKKLDGAMVEGDFQKLLFKGFAENINSKIFYPFMKDNTFFDVSTPLKEDNLLFVGNGPDYYVKGIDYLLDIFPRILKENPKTKLFIIGGDLEKFIERREKQPNVVFLGKQDVRGIKKTMSKCSLYCHFGRGEAFGVSTLESMAAGIPCIVSKFTGVGEVVKKVDENFVIDIEDKEKVIKKILEYFAKDVKEKRKLGKMFQGEARFFNENNCLGIFRKEFKDLVGEIDNGK
ncbi:glycosyltransferase family 4 protein [archaeon]|jgi:glycosyltransferase involved in cell wall biosynthesis|nr:glycosyltransferase family 4 protein [archaeon]MBT6182292.1 glycosyltransferase family 4 protein [archaeon]MBT6606096.1 glycosyltransferase family 4 protein [archaeon]MBT7252064.1 glycosyltransferase family 4 protein [archaeon]MBT7660987.1 glycosyltransferase family 4 protein [archaeon]